MKRTTRTHSRQAGFTLIELMVAVAIVGMLAAIAAPQLLGSREKAKHSTCLNAMHVLDGELMNRLEQFGAIGDATPAQSAIDEAIARIQQDQNATNPRDFDGPAFATVPSTLFVPPPESACTVFLIDGTEDQPLRAPTIIITAYERGVYSFNITLN